MGRGEEGIGVVVVAVRVVLLGKGFYCIRVGEGKEGDLVGDGSLDV